MLVVKYRDPLGDLGVDRRIQLKWILKTNVVIVFTGFNWVRIGSTKCSGFIRPEGGDH
jgi:hypothetical protein